MIKRILDAIENRLKTISELNSKVFQFRTYSFSELPAVNLLTGPMSHAERSGIVDTTIEVVVEIKVSANSENLSQALFDIHSSVYAALMNDETLGLDFVMNATPLQTGEPVAVEDSELPAISLPLVFSYQFRHQRADITQ